MLKKEMTKQFITRILKPGIDVFGKNFRIMMTHLINGIDYWKEDEISFYEDNLVEFFKDVKNKQNKIYSSIEPEVDIAGAIFHCSFCYFHKRYYRDIFSTLLVSASDKKKENIIHPGFVDIIKQLTSLEIRILHTFKEDITQSYPLGILKTINLAKYKYTIYNIYLIDFYKNNNDFDIEDNNNFQVAIENLLRLGLIYKIETSNLDYNYDIFKKTLFYSIFKKQAEINNEQLEIEKFRIELTLLGKDFLKCCF